MITTQFYKDEEIVLHKHLRLLSAQLEETAGIMEQNNDRATRSAGGSGIGNKSSNLLISAFSVLQKLTLAFAGRSSFAYRMHRSQKMAVGLVPLVALLKKGVLDSLQ